MRSFKFSKYRSFQILTPTPYLLQLPVWRVVITIQYDKNRHTVYSFFFVCINVAKFSMSVWRFSPHCVVKFTIVYSKNYKTVWKPIVWEFSPYSVCRILIHTHSKNIDKCGKNPQSARRKPNYHTKCGKNGHKILSVHERDCSSRVISHYAFLFYRMWRALFLVFRRISVLMCSCLGAGFYEVHLYILRTVEYEFSIYLRALTENSVGFWSLQSKQCYNASFFILINTKV